MNETETGDRKYNLEIDAPNLSIKRLDFKWCLRKIPGISEK